MAGIKITDKTLLEKLTSDSGFPIFDSSFGFRWEPKDYVVALLNHDFVGVSGGTVLDATNFQDFLVFTGATTFSATLPTAAGNDGQTIKVYAKLGESGIYSLDTTGGQTIDGAATRVILIGECVELIAISGQWYTVTAGILSVNGKSGVVVLDPDDLDDTATTNKFTDAAGISKLAGIEAGATDDQTDGEIKTAYENNANTNAFTDAEQTKLGTVETGATANQSDAEIKTAYENNANTNEFNDSEKTKLAGIESGATANQSDAEIKTAYENNANTNGYTDAEQAKLAAIDATHYGAPLQTLVQLSALTESSITDKARRYIEDEISDYFYDSTAVSGDVAPDDQTGGTGFWKQVSSSGETAASVKAKYESNANTNEFSDSEQTKLSGIETGATADQTDAQIKTAYENNSDTNEFNDAEKIKLGTVETGATADQTDAQIKTAYENNSDTNEFNDAEQTKLSNVNVNAEVNPDLISQAEAEAGTATTERIFSALRVKQAIDALSAGSGDVNGPPSSVNNSVARYDSTTGKLLQGYTATAPTFDDNGILTVNNTTESTSGATGCAVLKGGLGIAKDLNVSGGAQIGKPLLVTSSFESGSFTATANTRKEITGATTLTVTLPASHSAGERIQIYCVDSYTGVCTVDGDTTDTIGGNLTVVMIAGDNLEIESDGSDWRILNQYQANALTILSQEQTVDVTNRSTTSSTFVATGVDVTIDPVTTGSKIRVQVTGLIGSSGDSDTYFTFFRSINGGTAVDLTPAGVTSFAANKNISSVRTHSLNMDLIDDHGATTGDDVEYSLRWRETIATARLGRRGSATNFDVATVMTATEYI